MQIIATCAESRAWDVGSMPPCGSTATFGQFICRAGIKSTVSWGAIRNSEITHLFFFFPLPSKHFPRPAASICHNCECIWLPLCCLLRCVTARVVRWTPVRWRTWWRPMWTNTSTPARSEAPPCCRRGDALTDPFSCSSAISSCWNLASKLKDNGAPTFSFFDIYLLLNDEDFFL